MYTVTTKAPTIRLKIRLKKTRILPTAVIGPTPLPIRRTLWEAPPTADVKRRALPPPIFPLTSGAGLCRQVAAVSITNSASAQIRSHGRLLQLLDASVQRLLPQ